MFKISMKINNNKVSLDLLGERTVFSLVSFNCRNYYL